MIFSSSSDSEEDNLPLSETRKQLKSEFEESKLNSENQVSFPEKKFGGLFNFGASTSAAMQQSAMQDESSVHAKKFNYHPIRKRTSCKTIFESSSSISSSENGSSDEEWNSKNTFKTEQKRTKFSKNRRKATKKYKKRRVSSTVVSNPKPLSELPTSEEAREKDGESVVQYDLPRVRSMIIKRGEQQDQHYIQKESNSGE